MTVECTACNARYTIADSLVPPQGARVRCKKCGETIRVRPPAAPAAAIPAPTELPLVPPSPQPAAPAPPARVPSPEPAPPEPVASPSGPSYAARQAAPGGEIQRFPDPDDAPAAMPDTPAPPEAAAPDASPPDASDQAEAAAPDAHAPESFSFESASAGTSPPDAAAPPADPPPSSTPGGLPTGTPLPEGLNPEERQRHERARRLARVLASDIAIYNREKRDRGIEQGNLVAVLGYEIKKSWEIYKERVGADFANRTPYFRDALNEIVAEGRKIF